ncbi:MAG: YlxM family DNA-binding protein [Lachnospiraceae bacterium]|nr:YlxM family DNA-binding protein [Lachnospiraceae bacterium]
MEEKIRQGFLYDFYGELLNDHQKEIYESYIIEDLSLSEIASEQGISRQGVHDLIKRCNKTLEGYEDKLHLLERFMHIRDDVKLINELAHNKSTDSFDKICSISDDILDNL